MSITEKHTGTAEIPPTGRAGASHLAISGDAAEASLFGEVRP
jgi:hypothetical protein